MSFLCSFQIPMQKLLFRQAIERISLKTIEEERSIMPKFRRIPKITEELYNEIKPLVKTTRDDRKIMRLFGIKKTTAQKIRNTKNYWEYKNRRKNGKVAAIIDLDREATLHKEVLKEMKVFERDVEDLIVNCKNELREDITNLKIAGTIMWMLLLSAAVLILLFGR